MSNEPVVTAAPVAPVVEAPAKAEASKVEEVDPSLTPIAKHKIKWGDQEKEITVEEAVKLAEKAFGIENKAREAATKAEQADALLQMLKNDPKAFAKRAKAVGLDPQKLATDILYEQIRVNSLTPEQRELEELKAQQAEADQLRKDTEEAAKKAEVDKKTQEWAQKFEKELQTALEKKQLPMSRLTLALAAQYVDAGLAQKKEYTVEQVLPYVMRDLKNIHMSTMGSLEGEALLNYIGDDISNKIAAARVARYKKAQSAPAPVVNAAPKPAKEDISKLKGKAYWAALRRMKSEEDIGAFPGQE
eukprot:gnl/Spiro4/7719_TR4060_c0_g1_i1.p4 gnl/Spiro4/7719_TR4060_c0_g1~~gnl/Spiro4/7719_TR4060_c0_g1_i1.p4  ORF type:complete len:303 (-),score=-3.73 gnl/Spiro4/7719_TR4060_c0_g1_i1:1579-2487(-)